MTNLFANSRSLLGFTLILGGVIAGVTNSGAFPGWWALLPTSGAALIISANGAWLNRKILSHTAAVLVGLISYPLYLWHWPFLAYINLIDPAQSWQLRLEAILAAAMLAILTYHWIERPLRASRYGRWKLAMLCVAMALTGGAGLVVYSFNGVPTRLPSAIRDLANPHLAPDFRQVEWREGQCFFDIIKSDFKPQCLEQGSGPLLFLWGDSTSAALYPGLKQLQSGMDFRIGQYSRGGCPPSLHSAEHELPGCCAEQ